MDEEKLRRMSYKSHFWRFMHALVGTIGAIAALLFLVFGDSEKTTEVWHNITGSHTEPRAPDGAGVARADSSAAAARLQLNSHHYFLGDPFRYSFTTDRDGYVAIWNITASGKALRAFPSDTSERANRALAGQEYAAGRSGVPSLTVAGAPGSEELVLLWCPRETDHGFRSQFANRRWFDEELMRQRLQGCVDTRASYEIQNRANSPSR